MTPPMNFSILNRDSLLLALKQEKRPENYCLMTPPMNSSKRL